MTQKGPSNKTAATLLSLIRQGHLSGNAAEVARQCLRRLDNPLQVAIVGTDAALATGVLNLLAGQKIADPAIGHLSLRVEHGKDASATARYSDKSEATFNADTLGEAFKKNPKQVQLKLDLAPLTKATFLRITRDNPGNLQAPLARLAPTVDLVLWCGQSFGRDDMNVLDALENRTRDHCHMITSDSCYPSVMDGIAQDEFVSILPVDPFAAIDALNAEGGADKTAFKAAGGTDLIKTIRKEIEVTYQAALDTAEVIVLRAKSRSGEKETPKAVKPKSSPAAGAKTQAAPQPAKQPAKEAPVAEKAKTSEEKVAPKAAAEKVTSKPAAKVKPSRPKSKAPTVELPAEERLDADTLAAPLPEDDPYPIEDVIAKAKEGAATRTRILAKATSVPKLKNIDEITPPERLAADEDDAPEKAKKADKARGTPWGLGVEGDGLNELDKCVDLSGGQLSIRETSFEDKPVDFK